MTPHFPTHLVRSRPVGRYAPSPTGDLHLGNLRTAFEAWRDCRARCGIFILRMEDTDGPRTVPGAAQRILDDLRWLGIDWDEGPDIGGPAGPYTQSERDEFYCAALDELERRGLTYLCTCSRRDLREASAPHGDDPVYQGTCRDKHPEEQRRHPNGASVRLRIDGDPIVEYTDEGLGRQRCDLAQTCGDFVVKRRDGLWAYQLACAVDDALMGVTHVVRGRDLMSSAPRQVAIMKALGFPAPVYRHTPLVADAAGRRMCKRDGSESLRSLREAGMTPETVRRMILEAPLVS